MRKIMIILLLAAAGANARGQAVTGAADRALAGAVMEKLLPERDRPVAELMVLAAKELAGQPYVAGTLEEEPEELRVFLTKTDCILFVETCLDLALTVKEYGADFEKFTDMVRQSRYRDGEVRRYADRIHYTTEWIRQGEVRGILQDVTADLGGVVYDHPIFYMTRNYKRYKQLSRAEEDAEAAENLRRIAETEARLNEVPLTYIPEDRIAACEGGIRSGDIICFMSGTEGLDIAHVALAYIHDGKTGFIHASYGAKKVIADPKSIAEYALSSSNIPGIKVVRAL